MNNIQQCFDFNNHHQFDKGEASLLVHCSLLELGGATLANIRDGLRGSKNETGTELQPFLSRLQH